MKGGDGDMVTVFLNRNGDELFTYPNVDLHQGDRVKFNDKIYLVVNRTLNVVNRTFNANSAFYEIVLHESAEDE